MDTIMTRTKSTPYAGLAAGVAERRSTTAPVWTQQGTGLSFAGSAAQAAAGSSSAAARSAAAAVTAQAAVAGVRHTDLPGPVPRGAPV